MPKLNMGLVSSEKDTTGSFTAVPRNLQLFVTKKEASIHYTRRNGPIGSTVEENSYPPCDIGDQRNTNTSWKEYILLKGCECSRAILEPRGTLPGGSTYY